MNLTGQRNQCPGCGKYFNSNLAFDKHRTGSHGIDRRCKTDEEMINAGMAVNAAGFWIGSQMPQSVIDNKGEDHEDEVGSD